MHNLEQMIKTFNSDICVSCAQKESITYDCYHNIDFNFKKWLAWNS
jgi:hypothetical protein